MATNTEDADKEISHVVDLLIRTRLRCQPVIAVVGSGISAPQIPLMHDIIEKALEEFAKYRDEDQLLQRHPELLTREGLTQLFKKDPDPVLRNATCWVEGVVPWLRAQEERALPRPQHEALMRLLRHNLLRAIITTNWDCLLEDSTTVWEFGTSHSPEASDSEGECLDFRDFPILRSPQMIDDWIQQPSARPALIKIHGDVREQRCKNEHVTVHTPAGDAHDDTQETQTGPLPSSGSTRRKHDSHAYCNYCGEPMTPRLLLPDSARRLSREMLDYLRAPANRESTANTQDSAREDRPVDRFDQLGAIVVIGFSGVYDSHLLGLISQWGRNGCPIVVLDKDPKKAFSGNEVVLAGEAESLVPILAERWLDSTREKAKSACSSMALKFVPSEERYDSIFGRIPVTSIEAKILSHPEFSRLRHIRQLGQKKRFYPSADHSRYEHSVASLKLIDELYTGLIEAVERQRKQRQNRYVLYGYVPTLAEHQLVRLATLFHDYGHIWFSHLGEDVLKELVSSKDGPLPFQLQEIMSETHGKHELLTQLFLEHRSRVSLADVEASSLLSLLRENITDLLDELGITMEDFFALLAGQSKLGHLNALVASSIDADKLEYLRRDSSRTGRGAGASINTDAIAQAFEVTEFGKSAIRLDAICEVERVAAERYLMFQSVYHDARVVALEASLVQVLLDFLSEHLNTATREQVLDTLMKTEYELLSMVREVAGRRLSRHPRRKKPEQFRYSHWIQVLDLVEGQGTYPSLDLWLLYPAQHIRDLPLEDAREARDSAFLSLRKELGDLFYNRYQHQAVFALYKFDIHTGPSEIPVAGQLGLYWPRQVSPLIKGLQDVRANPMRLAVLLYDETIRQGCREEIRVIIGRHARDLELRVELKQ